MLGDQDTDGRLVAIAIGACDDEGRVSQSGGGEGGDEDVQTFFVIDTAEEQHEWLLAQLRPFGAESTLRREVAELGQIETEAFDEGRGFEFERDHQIALNLTGVVDGGGAIEVSTEAEEQVESFGPFAAGEVPGREHSVRRDEVGNAPPLGGTGGLVLSFFKQAVNVDDIGGGDSAIRFDGERWMARELTGGRAEEDHFDAVGAEALGDRETVLDFPGGEDGDVEAGFGLGFGHPYQGGGGAAVLGVEAGDDVEDVHGRTWGFNVRPKFDGPYQLFRWTGQHRVDQSR